MSDYILHLHGAYNVYSTTSDRVCYEQALTLDESMAVIKERVGEMGLSVLPMQLDRAHRNGCSGRSFHEISLDEIIAKNQEGPNQERISREEFIERFLTIDTTRR